MVKVCRAIISILTISIIALFWAHPVGVFAQSGDATTGEAGITFTEAQSYRVVFNSNFPDGSNSIIAVVEVPPRGIVGIGNMPSNFVSPPGFNFNRWTIAQNGSGSTFTANTTVDQIILNVFAQWTDEVIVTPPPVVTPPGVVTPPPVVIDPETPGPPGPGGGSEETGGGGGSPEPEPIDPPNITAPSVEPEVAISEAIAETIDEVDLLGLDPGALPLAALTGEVAEDEEEEAVVAAVVPTGNNFVTIGDQDIPLVGLDNFSIPLYGPINFATWALMNLILSIIGAVVALASIIRSMAQKKRRQALMTDDNAIEIETPETDLDYEDQHEKDIRRKKGYWAITSAVIAIIAMVVFILTQDMRSVMVLVDIWTIAHAVLLGIGIVSTANVFKRYKDSDKTKPEMSSEAHAG